VGRLWSARHFSHGRIAAPQQKKNIERKENDWKNQQQKRKQFIGITHTHKHTKENDFMKVCMEKASLGPPRSSWNYCESLLAEHFTKFILEIYLAP